MDPPKQGFIFFVAVLISIWGCGNTLTAKKLAQHTHDKQWSRVKQYQKSLLFWPIFRLRFMIQFFKEDAYLPLPSSLAIIFTIYCRSINRLAFVLPFFSLLTTQTWVVRSCSVYSETNWKLYSHILPLYSFNFLPSHTLSAQSSSTITLCLFFSLVHTHIRHMCYSLYIIFNPGLGWRLVSGFWCQIQALRGIFLTFGATAVV